MMSNRPTPTDERVAIIEVAAAAALARQGQPGEPCLWCEHTDGTHSDACARATAAEEALERIFDERSR